MTALELLAALIIDGLFGEPRICHPLVGFGAIVRHIEKWLNREAAGPVSGHLHVALNYLLGCFAVLLATIPFVVLLDIGMHITSLAPLFATATLYAVIGHRSLHEHAIAVELEIQHRNLPAARQRVGMLVSRNTEFMDVKHVCTATVESILENGNDALFGALFWFLVAGAPGALAYRLLNTLDAMWGYRTDRYRHFGWAAARLDDVANLIPARLTALSYAIVGQTTAALRCWWNQAHQWDSPNAGPVIASGAGALGVLLGGGAYYHGQWRERPALGEGRAIQTSDIERARQLLLRALLLWVGSAMVIYGFIRWLHA